MKQIHRSIVTGCAVVVALGVGYLAIREAQDATFEADFAEALRERVDLLIEQQELEDREAQTGCGLSVIEAKAFYEVHKDGRELEPASLRRIMETMLRRNCGAEAGLADYPDDFPDFVRRLPGAGDPGDEGPWRDP